MIEVSHSFNATGKFCSRKQSLSMNHYKFSLSFQLMWGKKEYTNPIDSKHLALMSLNFSNPFINIIYNPVSMQLDFKTVWQQHTHPHSHIHIHRFEHEEVNKQSVRAHTSSGSRRKLHVSVWVCLHLCSEKKVGGGTISWTNPVEIIIFWPSRYQHYVPCGFITVAAN